MASGRAVSEEETQLGDWCPSNAATFFNAELGLYLWSKILPFSNMLPLTLIKLSFCGRYVRMEWTKEREAFLCRVQTRACTH